MIWSPEKGHLPAAIATLAPKCFAFQVDTLNPINLSINPQMVQFLKKKLGGGFNYFLFSPRKLGKISILTNIFQLGWNHHLENVDSFKEDGST